MSIIIRESVREDVPAMFELIKELALYEKAPEQVTNTIEQMYWLLVRGLFHTKLTL